MTAPLRLLLVEDHLVMRAALRLLLESHPHLQAVGETEDGADAVELARRLQPHVILLDIYLAGQSSIACIPELRRHAPGAGVLILTGTSEVSLHRQALTAGAAGVVRKEQPAEVLLEAIECVAAGRTWIEATLLQALNDEASGEQWQEANQAIAQLTGREREVIQLIGEGLRNRHIAVRLNLSEKTVQNHLTSIFNKLSVRDRLELAAFARRHQLL